MTDGADNDAAIRAALAADDDRALDLVWDQYGGALFGLVASIVRSRHDAEEVQQEVFIKIARQRQRLLAAGNLRAYLYGMARNEALSWLRAPARREVPADPADFWLVPAVDSAPDEEAAAGVNHALNDLPEEQRTVVFLKIYHDQTFVEIGAALKISLNTAASRYRYALDKLRTLLREVK